jgi:hypothetical protein
MRHTVHLYLDDPASALSAALELLDSDAVRLESLQYSAGPLGKARLTAVVVAPPGSPGLERLRTLGSPTVARSKSPADENESVPYQWQADGAG